MDKHHRPTRRGPYSAARNDPLGLTSRQRCIFELLMTGMNNRAIAQRLCRSERTVEHHVTALFAKLGVTSRGELVSRRFEKWVQTSHPVSHPESVPSRRLVRAVNEGFADRHHNPIVHSTERHSS